MKDHVLTEKNFLIFAAANYQNQQCSSTEEFMEDVLRIKYVKKLLTRYEKEGDLKERLILNHLIILNNVFSPIPLCRILWLKMETQFSFLKPFLIQLGILIEEIKNVNEINVIHTDRIVSNQGIIDALRRI